MKEKVSREERVKLKNREVSKGGSLG